MTFTKKAAGELKVRLKNRFEEWRKEVSEIEIEIEIVNMCNKKFGLIFVGTIDSFCKKISGELMNFRMDLHQMRF